jgi:hypothetical protein
MTANAEDPLIRCRDACGAVVADEQEAQDSSWSWLSISKAWRCPECMRALRTAAALVGTDGVTADTLPPHSRGALPKETASSIAPPVVR